MPNPVTDKHFNSTKDQASCGLTREWAIASVAFVAVAVGALLLKGFSPARHFLGDGLAFSDWAGHWWTYWHYGQCLSGNDPCFTTGFLFFPTVADTLLLRGDVLMGFGFGLLSAIWSMNVSWNLAALFVLAGNGFGGYFLVRTVTGSKVGGVIAGLILLFCGQASWGINTGNMEYASRLWVCLFIAFLVKASRSSGYRDALLAGMFGAVAILSNFADAFHLPLIALIWIGFRIGQVDRRRLVTLLGAIVLAFVLCAPVGLIFHSQSSGREYTDSMRDIGPGQENGSALAIPLQDSHSAGSYLPWNRFRNNDGSADTYFVFIALALLGAIFMRREAFPWVASALLFFLLSLGPYLQFYDAVSGTKTVTGIPFPFLFAHEYFPFYFRMQFPARIFSYALIAGCVLVGYSAVLLDKIPRPKLRSAAILAIVLLASIELFIAWKVHFIPQIRVHSFYESLRTNTQSKAIIEIPYNFANVDATYQYYQTVHEKPIFNGMFAPYLREDPTRGLIDKNALLAQIDRLQQPVLAPWPQPLGFRDALASRKGATPPDSDYSIAAGELADLGFRFLVLHLNLPWENGTLSVDPQGPLSRFLIDAVGPPFLVDEQLMVFELKSKGTGK